MSFIINPYRNVAAGGGAFLPTDVTSATLDGWWDASDVGTITESGGLVSQINDKAGNTNHATQGTAASQPTTGVNTINGENALLCDGTDFLSLTTSKNYSGNYTFISVYNVNAVVLDRTSFIGANNTGSVGFNTGTRMNIQVDTGAGFNIALSGAVSTATDYIYIIRKTGAQAYQGYLNGSANMGTTTTAPNNGFDANDLMRGGSAFNDGLNGNWAEISLYDGDISDAELNQLGQTYADKYGLTWTDI